MVFMHAWGEFETNVECCIVIYDDSKTQLVPTPL